ncbi:hypothetical protein ACFYO1_31545 [Nocardia sp. NPDC006044]|uniref:hypothetical protein n=1 Tax=Nocardia sp. NPDC006044 TaxID=3364306 RepID=UPI0036BB060A
MVGEIISGPPAVHARGYGELLQPHAKPSGQRSRAVYVVGEMIAGPPAVHICGYGELL